MQKIKKIPLEKKKYFKNIKKNFYLFFLMFLTVVVIYSPKLFYSSYSIDTERMISKPYETLSWWLSLNRFGLVFLKKILPYGIKIYPLFINWLTYILLVIIIYLLCYLVFNQEKNNFRYMFLGSSLIAITTPITLEQTNFILQSVEVQIAVILQIASVFLLRKGIYNSKKSRVFFFVLSVLLLSFSFSVYQSLVPAFPILAVISVYFETSNKNEKIISLFKKYVTYILLFLVSIILYFLCNKIVHQVFDVIDVGYISYDFQFFKVPLNQFFINTLRVIKHTFFSINTPFLFIITTSYMALLFLLIIFNRNKNLETKVCNLIILSIVAISVFFLIITLGITGPIRSYYPTIPFALFFLSLACFEEIELTSLKRGLFCLTIILAIIQGVFTYKLATTTAIIYKEDVQSANVLKKEFNKLNVTPKDGYKIAVYGGLNRSDIKYTRGEIIGCSLFNYDTNFTLGNSQRISDFLTSQNFRIGFIENPEEYKKMSSEVKNIPQYPDKGFIKIYDNYLLINLSTMP
ncbi:glucosyltransferase domain-containing protein [Enterococcus sp. 22-H-5-01]|uniref:glucosyltransferase domain-containing protein n=1 Tax=Enterococcus sp. 22-H-5-01 TaxID=3418555 RepID=UPI003D04E338